MQNHTPALFFCALPFDLLTSKQMGFQDSRWNISMSSLVILAALVTVSDLSWEKQTDRQTNKRRWQPNPATAVGVGNNNNNPCLERDRLYTRLLPMTVIFRSPILHSRNRKSQLMFYRCLSPIEKRVTWPWSRPLGSSLSSKANGRG